MTTAKFHIIIPPQDIDHNPQCLQRIASGDPKAYEWLYKNYCSKLYDYLLLLTGDDFFAEDLLQEVFLKIWTNREKLATVSNFNSYLFTTAKNLLSDAWRRKQVEKKVLHNQAHTGEQFHVNDFLKKLQEQEMNAALESLTPRQQLIYRLIREEGRSRREISEALQISEHTVKATMQLALAGLKKRLTENEVQ